MHRWSIRLCRIAGTVVSLHASTLLLFAYIGWEGWNEGVAQGGTNEGLQGMAWALGFTLLMFLCIVLHEFGHIFAATRLGIPVPRVLLMPIGGMAEFSEIPRSAKQEAFIAIAGPLVNALIVALLSLFVPFPAIDLTGNIEASPSGIAQGLILANTLMGLFNLVPVFPMDGGRLLRAYLGTRMTYLRATFWAATLAKVLATTAMVLALTKWHMPMLALLFAFIFIVGEFEYRWVKRRDEWAKSGPFTDGP